MGENKKKSGKELHLLASGRRGFWRVIFSRTGIVTLLFLLGVFLIFAWVNDLTEKWPPILGVAAVMQFIVVLVLLNEEMESTAKNTWMLVMYMVPVLGPLFYLYSKVDLGSYAVRKRLNISQVSDREILPENTEVLAKLQQENPEVAALARYIAGTGNYPVFRDTRVDYYPLGENMWKAMLEDLKRAERFIFMEFFIIDEGMMWGQILDILAEKARAGVEVYVMYDGMCEFSTLTRDYPERMRRLGIKCRAFSPMTPFLTTAYNYRDHRKILVIDGKIAYNGGVNLADEYINERERFGHWKDTAVRLEGPAVNGFTVMFLEMWRIYDNNEINIDNYLTDFDSVAELADDFAWSGDLDQQDMDMTGAIGSDAGNADDDPADVNPGYVIPYGDSPLDNEKTGENVYMDMLYRSKEYVHIMTPYLVLDDEIMTALKVAAQKGIDVKIILPGIPDKKMVYALAKSYFYYLLKAGVKIYYYTPGFVHAKVFVSDHSKAVVGTINLDYRSLAHHFECATFLYDVPCIQEIEKDFQLTLSKCRQVTMEDIKNEKFRTKLLGFFLRMVAPLM